MKDLLLFHDRREWFSTKVEKANPHVLTGLWFCPDYSPERDLLCVHAGRSRILCQSRIKGRLADGRSILLFTASIRTRRGWKWLRFCRETPGGNSRVIARRLIRMPALGTSTEPDEYVAFDTLADGDAFLAAQSVPSSGPLVSVLIPVFNPPPACLEQAVASVQAQTYARWELCIADDASTDASVAPLLRRLAAADPRIKILFRPVNGHISAASNSALSLASGDWCALLDQDDTLSPHALATFVRAITARPDAEMVFSDEDKLDGQGRRMDPYRKPGWMPELLFGQNFVSHLGIYRTQRLRAIGGFREGFEGCQDWDMTLRFTHGLDPGHIIHLPFILYHWRILQHSTARAVEAKPYVAAAAERTVTCALAARGITARLSTLTPALFKVQFVASPLPSVCVVGRTSHSDQHKLAEATDGPLLSWAGESDSETLLERLLRAARVTDAEILVVMPPECTPRKRDWLLRLAGILQLPGVAAAAGPLVEGQGVITGGCLKLNEAGAPIPEFDGFHETAPGYFGRAQLLHNPDGLGLLGIAVRRTALLAINTFTSDDLVDPQLAGWTLCSRLRASAGRLVYDPGVVIDYRSDRVPIYLGEGRDLVPLLSAIRASR